jgi:hypothetical protein
MILQNMEGLFALYFFKQKATKVKIKQNTNSKKKTNTKNI